MLKALPRIKSWAAQIREREPTLTDGSPGAASTFIPGLYFL